MTGIPDIELSSGCRIPVLGMGTASGPIAPPEVVASVVIDAIKLGYRHLDTASFYQSEGPVGRAISEAVRRGLITSRSELHVTSKLWCTDAHHDLVLPALHKTLKTLGLGYLDLYLIHMPGRLKHGEITFACKQEDLLPFDIRTTWEAMEKCQRLGLVKFICVSNFSSKKLSELLSHGTISPAVNQVEMRPYWQQKELRDFCAKNGIHVSAYSPLGGKGTISLRWAFEQGVSFVPKSFNKGRMKENMEICRRSVASHKERYSQVSMWFHLMGNTKPWLNYGTEIIS
ncbi:hypothetical protein IFM89_009040 [Coptis chinensis]|uniref:NADP-dependent oxidoreductase domain-containing protein n=1 Tax=Coptis chinensis TaxID=261450 RepID=A0A835IUC1_9MAGN|nr:hypothetical protein IFM89_009040 [Coptis chinensis]